MKSGFHTKMLALGVAVSAVLLGIVVSRVDWLEFRTAFNDIRWTWVALGCAGVVASITARALRWAAISGANAAQLGAYWNATVIGYVANVLYPGRAGELLRMAALHRALGKPPGEVLATAFVDRMGDFVVLGVAALYVVGVLATQMSADAPVGWFVIVIVAPVALFMLLLRLGARLNPLVSRLSSALPGHWKGRIPRWYSQLLDGCGELADSKRLASAAGFTILAYCLDYAMFWLFLRAFEWPLPIHAAITLGVLLTIGSMLPAAPGYLGTYQVACVLALKSYGVAESSAIAYSVIAQGATLAVIGLLGLVVAVRYGFRLGLTKRIH